MVSQEFPIGLKDEQYKWLEEMAEKYNLDDSSKAVRCLINFGIQEKEHEASIFEEIRCLHC